MTTMENGGNTSNHSQPPRRLSDGAIPSSAFRRGSSGSEPAPARRVSINLPPDGTSNNRRPSGLRRTSLSRRRSSASMNGESDDGGGDLQGSIMQSREMKKMDRTVLCLRIAVIITLIVATTAVATVTFIYVSRDESEDFETEYDSAVVKVAEGFQNGVDTKVWSAQAFSAMYTSRYGDDGNTSTWPNATMPDFQEQASGQLLLADGRALSFNPIITNETRAAWEAHATESAYILGAPELVTRQCEDCRIVADGIYRTVNGTVVDDPGYSPESAMYPYTLVPVWQIAPIESNERAVMFNLHSEKNRRRALDDMLTYKVPALTAILQLVQDTEERPSSILFYPVISTFRNVTEEEVVGSISIVFSWDTVLERILPNYLRGIVCVLTTNTEQAYTFQLDGEDVLYVGEGDRHDEAYDDMEYLVDANVEGTSEELGVVDNLITYQLRCYPSKQFENQYTTNKPAIYTTVAVLIFVFTAALFLLYDFLVEHRQSRVSRAAERTGRIVDSMFPAAFRDRLFEQHEASSRRPSLVASREPSKHMKRTLDHQHVSALSDSMQTGRSGGGSNPRNKSIVKFLKVATAGKPDYNVGANLGSSFAEDPIADLYPETSIMFCDLVGFTAWSAGQSPNHVFCLLEAIFWEFDQLAQQYGVFKLGTIGDCYIAVTGLPNPMEKHASALAEFTIQCKKKVEEVRRSLEHTNLNWEDLKMRFGIHSGPVTAGILRGQKSRFELFGDTINTASRMESTSSSNCIQVSQETAELLRMEGMGSWLAPRQGLVSVKGKGTLSTFWLVPPDDEGNGGVPEELIASAGMVQQAQEEEDDGGVDSGKPRKRSSVVVPFTLSGSFDSTALETSQGDNKNQIITDNVNGDDHMQPCNVTFASEHFGNDVESAIPQSLECP